MKNLKPKDIQRNWRLVDAKNKILGRLSTEIARNLMGKNKSTYTPYLESGDYVVVINAKDIILSGKKETRKTYFRHTNYPGGLRAKTAAQIRSQKPEELIRHAVVGMLPKTKLGRLMARNLHVFAGSENPFSDKFKV